MLPLIHLLFFFAFAPASVKVTQAPGWTVWGRVRGTGGSPVQARLSAFLLS